jgi:hypothetical protein
LAAALGVTFEIGRSLARASLERKIHARADGLKWTGRLRLEALDSGLKTPCGSLARIARLWRRPTNMPANAQAMRQIAAERNKPADGAHYA